MEFQLTDEIRKLGFSRVCIMGKNLFVYNSKSKPNSKTRPIKCKYDKDDLIRTTNGLRKALENTHKFDPKIIDKFIILLSDLWVKLVEDQNNNDTKDQNKNKGKPSEAELTLEILNQEKLIHELFSDQYGTPYAAIKVDDHIETIVMRTKASTQMKNWICYKMYQRLGIVPKDESLNSILNVLRAQAMFDGNVRKLYLRAGPGEKSNEILYDLTNKNWEFVKITPRGWSIEKFSHVTPIFKRHRQLAQVYPSKEYPSDIFGQFMNLLNVKNENAKLLLKVYIILLVVHNIQKPILATHGEQGSAKSTLHEYIKKVIDPSAAVTLAFPSELVQKLDHNYVAYFDNISGIKEWISDQLCRSVTGSGFSKRQLFTDDQDIVYSFKRALGFNGINLAATKADLLDRCLIILLERIKDELRRPLEDIVNIKGMDRALEKIKPQLLGYIFDMVAKLLKVISMKGITKPKELPRMADFAIHGEIVARCIGYDKGVFLKAFNENTKLQSAELIESNPLAMTVFQFVQWKPQFKGTATKLLEELNLKAAELGIQQDKFWPKSPGALSRKLNLIRTSLRRVGVDIEFYEHTGISGKSRGIKICKISSDASEASVASDIPVNQARIDAIGSDDISDDIKDKNKVSSEKRGKSTRKKHFSDDTDDTDDILHTSGGSEHTYDYEKYVEEQKERIKNITDEESNSAITSKAYWSQNSGYWHCKTPKCRFTGDKFAIMKHSHENVGTKF